MGFGDQVNRSLYIAGSSREVERVQAAMAAARALGFVLTHDWTVPVLASPAHDRYLPREERLKYAHAAVAGVVDAACFWLLVPNDGGRGAWVEYGMGVNGGELDQVIVASGPLHRESIFCALADFECESDVDALAWLHRKVSGLL